MATFQLIIIDDDGKQSFDATLTTSPGVHDKVRAACSARGDLGLVDNPAHDPRDPDSQELIRPTGDDAIGASIRTDVFNVTRQFHERVSIDVVASQVQEQFAEISEKIGYAKK